MRSGSEVKERKKREKRNLERFFREVEGDF